MCKRCNHESWCHQDSMGPCEASEIISQSDFFEVEIAPGLKGVTQEVKYGDDCSCPEFTTRTKTPPLPKIKKEGLDRFLPEK